MVKWNVLGIAGIVVIAGVVVGPQLWHPYTMNISGNSLFKGQIDYVNNNIHFYHKH